jgi:hypothetical protein
VFPVGCEIRWRKRDYSFSWYRDPGGDENCRTCLFTISVEYYQFFCDNQGDKNNGGITLFGRRKLEPADAESLEAGFSSGTAESTSPLSNPGCTIGYGIHLERVVDND